MEALLTMSKKIMLLLLLMLCLYSFVFSADPFYINLLNEGKALYLAGKYDEAMENFKIAEFGLLDEKEFLPELFFYYALANYKKGMLEESRLLMDKMKIALGVTAIDALPRPKEIEHDVYVMTRAQQFLDEGSGKGFSLAFFNLFYQTWDLIKAKKLPEAEAGLERLEKLADNDIKLPFLQGFLAFQQQDYKKCIKRLEKTVERLGEEFREDASFYLAFSCLKRGETALAEKYAKNIKDPGYVHSLMVLMDEIKAAQVIKNKKK
jgi:tetratricopeptide (TPR) repeat protein